MVRRSFRIGLRLGLLFGVAFALVKTVQSRRTASSVPPPAPWEPLDETPTTEDPPEPLVDEVGEPIMEPAAPEEPSVVATPTGDELLHAKAAPAPDPALDVIPEPTEVESTVKKVAAKKLPAAKSPARSDEAAPSGARLKKAAAPRKAAAKKAAKKKAAATASLPAFVEPEGGVCPTTHPVKAKLTSRLFHLPGMFAYDRTRPDRCYVDAEAAVTDGFTQAKR